MNDMWGCYGDWVGRGENIKKHMDIKQWNLPVPNTELRHRGKNIEVDCGETTFTDLQQVGREEWLIYRTEEPVVI